MWLRASISILAFYVGFWVTSGFASETGDPAKGQEVYRACVSCDLPVPSIYSVRRRNPWILDRCQLERRMHTPTASSCKTRWSLGRME